jgi:raffinose synthase
VCAGNAKARVAKQLPDFVDVFGWCTWDAFYSRVSAEGELRQPLA